MLTLIRGGTIYAPAEQGKQDLLLAGGRIVKIAQQIEIPESLDPEIVEAEGKIVTPGFIDLHVHIIGGGGERGPATRAPEIRLSRITRAGVTTVLGVLGTDDVSRHPESLLAKALGLEQDGITAFILTGSYRIPPVTITGSVRKDIALIPNVVGVGEIAVSDYRSSQPTFEELARVAAEAMVGGMLGGKAGLVHFHVGPGARGLEHLFRLVEETEIPIEQFLPTHIARTPEAFEHALRFALMGGNVDITATGIRQGRRLKAAEAMGRLLSEGVPVERITLSSDSNGSMPVFDEKGNIVQLSIRDIYGLYKEFRGLITEGGFAVSDVLKTLTLNPATRLHIQGRKGSLEEGKDADLIVFHPDWSIDRVYARGRLMVSRGEPVVKGTFE